MRPEVMPLRLNLATGRYVRARRAEFSLYGLIAFLLLLAWYQMGLSAAGREDHQVLHQRVVRVEEQKNQVLQDLRRESFDPTEAGVRALAEEVAFVNNLLERRSFSWTRFLSDLEAAVPSSISITRIQPEPGQGKVAIDGVALSLKALTDLIVKLEESPAFDEVFLAGQRARKDDFIDFSLKMSYRRSSPAPG